MKITTLEALRPLNGTEGWFYSLDWQGEGRPGPLLKVRMAEFRWGVMFSTGDGPDDVDYAIQDDTPEGTWAFFPSETRARLSHQGACSRWAYDRREADNAYLRDVCGL